ncbi:insulin-like growth factor II [Lethenteron reissneri]|uniref:insulin-like growth factor II n=1 Tax=Lethenteron reissneri TaxID=7753 RepID=UPI002AB6BCA3|nr:insulin-like growth factor II [Lethenteron reissneri]XP_061437783.1 insulin-like growth factor II [Lethenteron reissneri]
MASRHPRPQRLWLLAPLALCVLLHHQSAALTLCGSQLVDALAFVCNGRGFYAAPPAGVQRQRQQLGGITEACCLRACSLLVLERYCAQPQLLELSSADPDRRLSTWKGEGLVDCVLRFVRSALRGRNIETKASDLWLHVELSPITPRPATAPPRLPRAGARRHHRPATRLGF